MAFATSSPVETRVLDPSARTVTSSVTSSSSGSGIHTLLSPANARGAALPPPPISTMVPAFPARRSAALQNIVASAERDTATRLSSGLTAHDRTSPLFLRGSGFVFVVTLPFGSTTRTPKLPFSSRCCQATRRSSPRNATSATGWGAAIVSGFAGSERRTRVTVAPATIARRFPSWLNTRAVEKVLVGMLMKGRLMGHARLADGIGTLVGSRLPMVRAIRRFVPDIREARFALELDSATRSCPFRSSGSGQAEPFCPPRPARFAADAAERAPRLLRESRSAQRPARRLPRRLAAKGVSWPLEHSRSSCLALRRRHHRPRR